MDWRKYIADLWPDADPDDPEVQDKVSRRAFLIGTAATTAAVALAPVALTGEPDFEVEPIVAPKRTIWQVPDNLTAEECTTLFNTLAGRPGRSGDYYRPNNDLLLRTYLDGLRRRPVA